MFPVACTETAMHDAVFFSFYFIQRKTAMRTLSINRTARNTHSTIPKRGAESSLVFILQIRQELPKIELPHKLIF